MRNLSLTLESVTESLAAATGVQQKSLLSLARVAHGKRRAFESLVAGQRGVCAVDNMTCCI